MQNSCKMHSDEINLNRIKNLFGKESRSDYE